MFQQPAPPMPNELQGALGEKEFSDRMNILLRTLGRYSWSNMMRIYTTVVIVFSFIVVRTEAGWSAAEEGSTHELPLGFPFSSLLSSFW